MEELFLVKIYKNLIKRTYTHNSFPEVSPHTIKTRIYTKIGEKFLIRT